MQEDSRLVDDNEIALKIIEVCQESENGIQHDQLSQLLNAPEQKIVEILNYLIRADQITVQQAADNTPVYQYQDPERFRRFSGLNQEARHIYQLISDSQGNGLTKVDLKTRSKINTKVIDDILKDLKKRNLIKSEKALNKKNNVWILFELEPSTAVKGNVFYNKGEFDRDLADAVYDKILSYIENSTETKGSATKKEVSVYLRSTEYANMDLRDEDIQSIINILIYDDKIEKLDEHIYRVCDWGNTIKEDVINITPCGTCPLFNECREGSIISPEKCIYYLQW